MIDDINIVDCDVHVHELPQELARYCQMPWRKAVEAIAPAAAVTSRFGSVGDYVVPGLAQGTGDGSDPLWPGGQNRTMFVVDPAQCRLHLDRFNIESAVLFPDHLLKIAIQVNGDYAMAVARAYNRWLIDKWLKIDGFYGALCVAPQDPEGSAAEIRELGKKHKMACVFLPSAGVNPLYSNIEPAVKDSNGYLYHTEDTLVVTDGAPRMLTTVMDTDELFVIG